MWYKASNSNSVRPAEIDAVSSPAVIYVRKDFELIAATEETPEHWDYQEAKLSPTEYELYMDNVALRDYLEMIG